VDEQVEEILVVVDDQDARRRLLRRGIGGSQGGSPVGPRGPTNLHPMAIAKQPEGGSNRQLPRCERGVGRV
jgi:hypothetical protein